MSKRKPIDTITTRNPFDKDKRRERNEANRIKNRLARIPMTPAQAIKNGLSSRQRQAAHQLRQSAKPDE